MNKKTITLILTTLLAVMGVKADVIPSSYYSTGASEATYYLYNVTQATVGNNAFLNDESITAGPRRMTLKSRDNGTFSIMVSDNSKYLKIGYSGGNYFWNNILAANYDWTSNAGSYFKWTFTPTGTGTFKLSITAKQDADGKFIKDHTYYLNTRSEVTEDIDKANEWALISLANYNAYENSIDLSVVDDATVTSNKTAITTALGDATSLINTDFESNWSGGTKTNNICKWNNANNAYDYEQSSSATVFRQTIENMPAGTYLLVAAVRGNNGSSAIAQIGGVNISSLTDTKITNGFFGCTPQININGVQMPYSDSQKNGFAQNTDWNYGGWRWITAKATLTTSSDLLLAFIMDGNTWKGIADVHLYYMSDGANIYAVEYEDGMTYNPSEHAVACNFTTDNPNKIFTSSYALTTASSAQLNNNLVNGTVANLVLYDGYAFSADADFTATAATLYRGINASAFATVCAPFAISGGADGTFYQPTSLTSGTLNFGTEASPAAGKAYLYKASSAVTALTGSGTVKAAPVDNGEGVVMKGRFSKLDAIDHDNYVLSGTNLYKVNSTVSCSPFRAYFNIPDGGASAHISLNFDGEDVTGITLQEIESESENAGMKDGKYFENGRIVIVKNGVKYSVNGSILK